MFRPSRRIAAAMLAAWVAGCASSGASPDDALERIGADQFRFVAKASMMQPANSRQAEAARVNRLTRLLAERGWCPRGWRVLARGPAFLVETDTRYEYAMIDIVYVGRCAA